MIIHKGKTYTIESDGMRAVKTDGISTRSMKFYPERDASTIAGNIDELSAWRILHDISSAAISLDTPIHPEHILINDDGFILSEWSQSHDMRFVAPEGYSKVWALGASVFYLYLGCHVFQGLGGKGQTDSAPVPFLRRNMPELSGLLLKCLDFNPSRRPGLSEIKEIAIDNIKRCKSCESVKPPFKPSVVSGVSKDELDTLWPDKMY